LGVVFLFFFFFFFFFRRFLLHFFLWYILSIERSIAYFAFESSVLLSGFPCGIVTCAHQELDWKTRFPLCASQRTGVVDTPSPVLCFFFIFYSSLRSRPSLDWGPYVVVGMGHSWYATKLRSRRVFEQTGCWPAMFLFLLGHGIATLFRLWALLIGILVAFFGVRVGWMSGTVIRRA